MEGRGVPECCDSCQQVARIVLRAVAAGKAVEIDGLGIFYPDARRGFRFVPRALPQVFIAYGKEDEERAWRLCEDLNRAGFSPWMDVRKLLAGQNWPRAIEAAIESSDFLRGMFFGEFGAQEGRIPVGTSLRPRLRAAGAAG